MASFEIIKVGLDKLGGQLLKDFAIELAQQGHKATGQLIASLRKDIMFQPSGYRLVFFSNDYGLFLEKKRQPGKYVPIAPLMKWIATKGMASTNKEIRSIAFAISRSIFLEGIPTTGRRTPKGKGAFVHSKVGRRTAWIHTVVKKHKENIKQQVQSMFSKQINITVSNAIRETNKTIA